MVLFSLLLTAFSKAGRRQSLLPSYRWGEWAEKGNLPSSSSLP